MFEKVKPFLDRLAAFDPWAWLFAFGLLLAVVLTVWVLWEIWQFVMRSQVARAYGFQVPRKVRVRPRRDDGYQGEFRLAIRTGSSRSGMAPATGVVATTTS